MIGEIIFLGLIFGIGLGGFLFLLNRKILKKKVLKKMNEGTLGMITIKDNENIKKYKDKDKINNVSQIHTRTSEVNRMLPKGAEESNTLKVVENKEDSIPPLSHSDILKLLPKNNKKKRRKRFRRRNRKLKYNE